MAIMVEKISALTFRVSNMKVSVQFYRDVLGMELLYGGETAGFSSLRAKYPLLPSPASGEGHCLRRCLPRRLHSPQEEHDLRRRPANVRRSLTALHRPRGVHRLRRLRARLSRVSDFCAG